MSKNKKHWDNLAKTFENDVCATTKSRNIKQLEIFILKEHIKDLSLNLNKKNLTILEVGCGNGQNLAPLSKEFPEHIFYGIDFSEEMIRAANIKPDFESKKINYSVGNALNFCKTKKWFEKFDLVFTNRCLINVAQQGEISDVISEIKDSLKLNGSAIFIENFIEGRKIQDDIREALTLPRRSIPEYNVFLEKNSFIELVEDFFHITEFKCISSLYDFIQYIVSPLLQNGEINYNDALIKTVTDAIINTKKILGIELDLNVDIGQNFIVKIDRKK